MLLISCNYIFRPCSSNTKTIYHSLPSKRSPPNFDSFVFFAVLSVTMKASSKCGDVKEWYNLQYSKFLRRLLCTLLKQIASTIVVGRSEGCISELSLTRQRCLSIHSHRCELWRIGTGKPSGTNNSDDNWVRCIPARLGGSALQPGAVVTSMHINCLEFQGPSWQWKRLSKTGQHNSHLVCESNVGDPLIQPLSNSRKSVAVVSTKRDKAITSRGPECMGECRVSYTSLKTGQASIWHWVLDLLGPCQIDLT